MWAALSPGQAECVVSLVQGHSPDTTLVSSLCGGQVSSHSLLLALHSPLLAKLLSERGPGPQAVTLPFTLSVMTMLVDIVQGGEEIERNGEVVEAAELLGIILLGSKVNKYFIKNSYSGDINPETVSGKISADDKKKKVKNTEEINQVLMGKTAIKLELNKGLEITTNETSDDNDLLLTDIFAQLSKTQKHADIDNSGDGHIGSSKDYPHFFNGVPDEIPNSKIIGTPKLKKQIIPGKSEILGRFLCDHCSLSFKTHVALKRHVLKKHGNPICCQQCGEEFSEVGRYKKHIKMYHTSKFCEICSVSLTSRFAYYEHKKTHNKQIIQEAVACQYCGKEYSKLSGLNGHVIRHHGEKDFKCTKCDYKSKSRSDINCHYKRRHTEQLQKICGSCGEVFKNLRKHIKRNTCGANGQIEKEKVSCKLNCGKTFINNEKMQNHLKNIHENIKNKVCSHCSYATYSSFNLKLHVTKMHFGISLAKKSCDFCEKKTMNLDLHIQTYHSEEK